jgi:hypothetical protein
MIGASVRRVGALRTVPTLRKNEKTGAEAPVSDC